MIGKTHLATALGYAACQHGYSVLFANAIDVINTLSAAQTKGALKSELKRYLSPALLLLERSAIFPSTSAEPTCSSRSSANATNAVLSSLPPTKPSNNGATIFNGDSTITSAVLDRLLHHAETVLIEGSSYRMKDRIES